MLRSQVNFPLEPGVGAHDEPGAVVGAVTRALTVIGRASHGVSGGGGGGGGGGGTGLSRGPGGNSSRRGRREEGGPTPLVPGRPDSKYTIIGSTMLI